MQGVYLIGAGGHAKVIIDTLQSVNLGVLGIFDKECKGDFFYGIPYLGDESKYIFDHHVIISIGSNVIRKKVLLSLQSIKYASCVHCNSSIAKTVRLGEGSVVFSGAVVQSDTIIGTHVIINTNSSVDHDCNIEDFVHISPGATVCGGVSIGEGTHIGAGAICIPGVRIGKWCTIGAGAVVIRDIPDFATAVGSPAKIIKYK